MHRIFQYRGFNIEVTAEADFNRHPKVGLASYVGYVATVRILRPDLSAAVTSPLRFGDTGRHLFTSEGDALMGGCSAGQRLVDDVCGCRDPR